MLMCVLIQVVLMCVLIKVLFSWLA